MLVREAREMNGFDRRPVTRQELVQREPLSSLQQALSLCRKEEGIVVIAGK